MKGSINIQAYLERAGALEPFRLSISAPVPSAAMDYYCKVHAPALLDRDAEIFGIDASQARELAVQFVRSMLGDAKVVDEQRRPVDW